MILNQGVTGYSFTYKPDSVHSSDLSGEQFLVVDFQNFEIRDQQPNLPKIRVLYFNEEVSEEELELDPTLMEKASVEYYDSSFSGWDYDEGYYFLPLLSEVAKVSVKLYRISIHYSESSFLQSIKFSIGVYSPHANSNIHLDSRIPIVASEKTTSVLAVPLEYNNKPKVIDREDNRLNSIECGVEINVCRGKLKKLQIFAQSSESSEKLESVLEIGDMDDETDPAEYRGFTVPFGSKSLRIETSAKVQTMFGKIRVTCQDVQAQVDLG